jgi:predicted Rossmann-fold nucleotide-binding protein
MPDNTPKDRFYYNLDFLSSPDARSIRIMTEFYGPFHRFRRNHIADTIVFFGSARLQSREKAQAALDKAPKNISQKKLDAINHNLEMSKYYEDARELAKKMTIWSKGLKLKNKRFIIASGGGPGIMEAANRGASEAKGVSVGLTISLPMEDSGNKWISRNLSK